MTTTTPDLTTMTPVEVDTVLARLLGERYTIENDIALVMHSVMRQGGAKRLYGRGQQWSLTRKEAEANTRALVENPATTAWDKRSAERTLTKLDEARAALRANAAAARAYNDEFARRGGWTRAFLVTDGHVHSSMQCSTCNNGEYATQFSWLTEFSGHTEAEVVAAAADRACTVCYPTAPVETAGPSALMTPDERTRAEKRDDAEAARRERNAKKIAKGLTADGSEFVVEYVEPNAGGHERGEDGRTTYVYKDRVRTERFKTEQAAIQWVVRYTCWGHGEDYYADGFRQVIEAVAAKHGQSVEEVEAMIAAKVAAKNKRDSR